MKGKQYNILLNGKQIGTTELEKADAPMGVVFGQIKLIDITSGYDFFKSYCSSNNISIISDYPAERLISSANIPQMKIVNAVGLEINGLGVTIEGMDDDKFEVTISGIPYPFFETEFPHHMKEYHRQFGN